MDYVLDTNILLIYLRNKQLVEYLDKKYDPLSFPNNSIISVVSIGELKSIALRNGWGPKQKSKLNEFVKQFLVADINVETIIDRYAEIDAYSQGKLHDSPIEISARNMGKNDLWIASTASVLRASLITTDKDFNHLDNEFLKLEYIDISQLSQSKSK